jgi:vancomycin resistance protein YoaR
MTRLPAHAQIHPPKKSQRLSAWLVNIAGTALLTLFLVFSLLSLALSWHESRYQGKNYPNVTIAEIPFGGRTVQETRAYWRRESLPYSGFSLEFQAEDRIATLSGQELGLGYDYDLAATQAYLIGRSGNIFTKISQRFLSGTIDVKPIFRYETGVFDQMLETLAYSIDIPAQEALFNFADGRVREFKPSLPGKKLDIELAKAEFSALLSNLPGYLNRQGSVSLKLPVVPITPQVTTGEVNDLGIQELIGRGHSVFSGSIPGRIHNVALAASRIHGLLIPPGETFSFNKALGDVSLSTGYRQAYIIQNGRTILGDGGGICQVSTTVFRAALNTGLPIMERHAHAYRVHYYEDGGFKAGLDATVFDPSVDLKILNDTGHHLLIQTKTDTRRLTLDVEFYGTGDGRIATLSNHRLWSVVAPPEPLYQDDPTLPAGQIKQIDWAAWGAKANFDYKVTRNGATLIEASFFSNYRPWQAVYLRGVGPN